MLGVVKVQRWGKCSDGSLRAKQSEYCAGIESAIMTAHATVPMLLDRRLEIPSVPMLAQGLAVPRGSRLAVR